MAPLNREAKLKWINIKTDGFPKEIAETLKLYGKADIQIKKGLTDVLTAHPLVPKLDDGYGFKYSLRVDETGAVKVAYAQAKLPSGSGEFFDPFEVIVNPMDE